MRGLPASQQRLAVFGGIIAVVLLLFFAVASQYSQPPPPQTVAYVRQRPSQTLPGDRVQDAAKGAASSKEIVAAGSEDDDDDDASAELKPGPSHNNRVPQTYKETSEDAPSYDVGVSHRGEPSRSGAGIYNEPMPDHTTALKPMRSVTYFDELVKGNGEYPPMSPDTKRREAVSTFWKKHVQPQVGDGFLEQYTNKGCWKDRSSGQLNCIPGFYILGFNKCGTTDLAQRLIAHDQIVDNTQSTTHEIYWWHKHRPAGKSLKDYAVYIKPLSDAMSSSSRTDMLSFDGSVQTVWWQRDAFQGISLAELITGVQPEAPLIVCVRDPVNRFESDFFYSGYGRRGVSINVAMQRAAQIWFNCRFSNQKAVQTDDALDALCLSYLDDYRSNSNLSPAEQAATFLLFKSLYRPFILHWRRLVPREKLHVQLLEDFVSHPRDSLRSVAAHIGATLPSEATLDQMVSQKTANKGGSNHEHALPSMRHLLAMAVCPSFKRLAQEEGLGSVPNCP